jgi:hypothetical protein
MALLFLDYSTHFINGIKLFGEIMKNLTLLFIFVLVSCSETPLPVVKNEQTKEVAVYLDYKDNKNIFTISERYRLKGDKCNIAWTVITSKESQNVGLVLRYMHYLANDKGCKNFSSQIEVHQKILAKIFTKYDTSKFTWVRTEGMRTLNPSGEWNEKMKKLSAKNIEWIDFTRNYPNHKSQKSSNSLLKEELINNFHIIKEFTDIFLPTFSLEISSVEKVFTEKVNKQSVFYDAGIFNYKVIPNVN